MKSKIPLLVRPGLTGFISLLIAIAFFAAPLSAQQPEAKSAKTSKTKEGPPENPTFDTLLAADSYKLYGEVRNLGQLMSTGGAGEIIDPIIKLADPPREFKSIVKFLKSNAEALASSRLLFATMSARVDVPKVLVAIEFATPEEAAKFAPKLETFLPTVLPAIPVENEEKPSDPAQTKPSETGQQVETRNQSPGGFNPNAPPPAQRLPFVITHAGSLVFISDRPFKLEKIRPAGSKLLAEDQNFRVAHDRFSAEPVFLFLNVQLEDRAKPKPLAAPVVSEEEMSQQAKQRQSEAGNEFQVTELNGQQPAPPGSMSQPAAEVVATVEVNPPPETSPRLTAPPPPSQVQRAQMAASSQVGHMLGLLGLGEPQWPEAVGIALALDNNEYVIRAILVEPQNSRKLPLPFVPQLISGLASVAEASSVLPDDTEVFVSASIDFLQTYEGMRKQADVKARSTNRQVGMKEPVTDPFDDFERKAGFKIREDLLPALGNEIAIAGSLKSLQGVAGFNLGIRGPSTTISEPGAKDDQDKKGISTFPMLLISVKDRDAAQRLIPRVLDGMGMGEANLIAQKERREDTELVNYAGVFAYAFVGNFLVISEAATVRRVIDANLNHQTLASNSVFRNSSRWEPRQSLGQIYISPALMESYQEQVRKQAATMDPAMRDFVMRLSPGADAITYALSNEGLGALHELHLPKNLIITMVAGTSSSTRNPPPEMNEAIAMSMLQMIVGAEMSYKTNGNGSYASMDQLAEQKLITREMLEKYGYKIEVTSSATAFEAVATPVEYGKTGKRSFFIDQSNVLRGDDHGGGPATIADKPVQSP